jgi:hypothetical protein
MFYGLHYWPSQKAEYVTQVLSSKFLNTNNSESLFRTCWSADQVMRMLVDQLASWLTEGSLCLFHIFMIWLRLFVDKGNAVINLLVASSERGGDAAQPKPPRSSARAPRSCTNRHIACYWCRCELLTPTPLASAERLIDETSRTPLLLPLLYLAAIRLSVASASEQSAHSLWYRKRYGRF